MQALTFHGAHDVGVETVADPTVPIILHRMPLAHAAGARSVFDEKQEDCRKVVLRPS